MDIIISQEGDNVSTTVVGALNYTEIMNTLYSSTVSTIGEIAIKTETPAKEIASRFVNCLTRDFNLRVDEEA